MSTGTLNESRQDDNDTDEDGNWDGIDRRNRNVTLMRLRTVESELGQHVKHCARLQKTVLGTVLITLGWIVTHSPEVAAVLGKMVTRLGAP